MKKDKKNPNQKTIIVDTELHKEMKIVVANEQITLNELITKSFNLYKKSIKE